MGEPRRIVVTGATGLVGGRLLPALLAEGWQVRAVTRSPARARVPPGVEPVGWDGVRVADAELEGCEAVVHLAGEPVFGGRLGAARRERILASRVDSTRAFARAFARLGAAGPRTFVCASAVGYYGDRGDERLEESAPPGRGFLADVCVAWEEEARAAAEAGVRSCSLRIGVVLAREGGALAPLARAFRFALGGRIGSGRQWFPWIHVDDLVALIRTALVDPSWHGAVNAVAPGAVRNAELAATLSRVVHRPAWIPVPAAPLRLLLGELSRELLDSRRVVPSAALGHGFRFAHPDLEEALRSEVG
jgi:uncharacterized protein (TIGR01777 family)